VFGRATIALGIGPHSSSYLNYYGALQMFSLTLLMHVGNLLSDIWSC